MKVTTTEATLRTLTPDAGKWLTQADTEAPERIFSKIVYLGADDAPDNWEEWTNESKTAYEMEEKARREAERKKRYGAMIKEFTPPMA